MIDGPNLPNDLHTRLGSMRAGLAGRRFSASKLLRAGLAIAVVGALSLVAGQHFSASSSSTAPSSPPPRPPLSAVDAAKPASPAATEAPLPDENALFRVEVTRASRFAWPAIGPLTSFFGPGHPTGIDIGLDPSADSPVLAAAAGTVAFAGGSECCGYGLHVVVDHADAFTTLYGHLSKIDVKEGQHVEQGDLLGFGGNTGESTGYHLHFEIDDADRAVDPLRYLSATQGSSLLDRRDVASCGDAPIAVQPASRVRFKFTSKALADYGVSDTSVDPATASNFPEATAERDGWLAVAVTVPPASAASGRTSELELLVRFQGPGEDKVASCLLSVSTLQTQANEIKPKSTAPTATSTATPTPRPATATPTRTPTPKPASFGAEPPITVPTATPTKSIFAPAATRTPAPGTAPAAARTPTATPRRP